MEDAILTRRLVPDLHRSDSGVGRGGGAQCQREINQAPHPPAPRERSRGRQLGHSGPPLIETIDPLRTVRKRVRRGDYDRPEVPVAVADRLLQVL